MLADIQLNKNINKIEVAITQYIWFYKMNPEPHWKTKSCP